MANGKATAQAIDGHDEADLIISTAADELKLITGAVRALSEHAVKELLSIGVCVRCIFRIFCVHEHLYSCALLSPSLLGSILGNATELEGDPMVSGSQAVNDSSSLHSSPGIKIDADICRICLGILQFLYYDQQDVLVKRDCASDFASTIADVIKQDGHIIDNFSLEVSLPQFIMENEESVWSHIKKKYHSELWYQKIVISELISIKDVLKLSLTNPLEALLGVKSDMSSFRIRLTYTHLNASMNVKNIAEKNQCSKRRKTDDEVGSNYRLFSGDIDGSNLCSNERYESTKSSSNGLQDHEMADFHLEKLLFCGSFAFRSINPVTWHFFVVGPTYIGGRYLKFSRNVSQTRWIIDDERMGDASVEEIIGGNILPTCRGDIYKFHAAGREDIDVRMLGSGRPFLIEIQNARHVPSDASIKEIERKINSLENKLVMVKNLKVLGSEAWTLMREGEAEKQKQYAALVWISRSLNDDDSQIISSLKDVQILQRTPVRVLHRRSPLEREKIIHWMKIERIAASSQYFLLHLCTQAGTYIKEFVHGDLGRTHPSIGSILGCRAEILQLDVTDVKMDCFLADGI